MSFPNDSVVCSERDWSPTSASLLSLLSILLCFRLPSSFDAPTKLFYSVIYRVTNGVPRGLYSRVAVTPLASSPWPAHAIYLSRLRDSTPLSQPPFLLRFRAVPLQQQPRCIIRAAKPFLDQLSTSLPTIFSLRARAARYFFRKRIVSIYESIRDTRHFCSNLNRISDYLRGSGTRLYQHYTCYTLYMYVIPSCYLIRSILQNDDNFASVSCYNRSLFINFSATAFDTRLI